jgi:hypothetical protein
MFQSMNVLKSHKSKGAIRHDYCDDIESFFYVFTYILFAFASPGKLKPMPDIMQDWDADKPTTSQTSKWFVITCDAESDLIADLSPWWSPTARSLFFELQRYIKDLVLFRNKGGEISGPQANAHYDELEAIFQVAIDAAAEPANMNPPPAPSPVADGPSTNAAVTQPQAAASVVAGEATKPRRERKTTGSRKRVNSAPARPARSPNTKAAETAGPSNPTYPRTRAASALSKRPSQDPDPVDERAPKRQRSIR